MKTIRCFFLLLSILIFACSSDNAPEQQQMGMEEDPSDDTGGQQGDPEPSAFVVTSFSPAQAFTGETVTIIGDSINLYAEYRVTFNNIESPRVTVTETQIEAVIPNGEAGGTIRVQHDTFDIEVGIMDVVVESAFVFTGYFFINPNSGIPAPTHVRNPLSDDARIYVKNRVIDPGGNNDEEFCAIDIDTDEVHGYGQGNWHERRWTGSSKGFLYSDLNNGTQLHKFARKVFGSLEIVGVPSEYTLLQNFYFEDLSKLGYIVTIDGQTGKHLWKVNMETGVSETVALGNNLVAFGESKDEELIAIKTGATNQLIRIDRNTGMVVEVLYDGIPAEFTSKRIMQSKSTGRYFLLSPSEILIINLDDGSLTFTEYELSYPQYMNFANSIFKVVNF